MYYKLHITPPRQEFSTGRLEGDPSADIDLHFGEPVAENRNNVKCKLCELHKKASDHKEKGREAKIQATNRRGQNVYEEGGRSNARGGSSGSGTSRLRLSESEDRAFQLRSADIELVRSRSTKQSKITGGLMKTLRKKQREAVSKLIIYEHLPMNLASSFWLQNLINAAAEIGTGVKFPTPYEISDVYLESEFQSMKELIDRMKMIFQEKCVTIMRNIDYYFKLLDKVVEEVGEEYVVQVVTDNEETMDETTTVINKLERDMDNQIRAINQLMHFREKQEKFGTPQAQRAWFVMNPLNGGLYMVLILLSFNALQSKF
ncbi:uncharacterized protein G2W53_033527 [Senna tora]|uniref:DUF659 domain-containing protein n=1 Tax=Senna tora TaxID=362788 RepID=A0A834T1F8_9FABA|nr:uncharacterized protein G2W53_033527 [Senna tora]